jgi:hypothetical protein
VGVCPGEAIAIPFLGRNPKEFDPKEKLPLPK